MRCLHPWYRLGIIVSTRVIGHRLLFTTEANEGKILRRGRGSKNDESHESGKRLHCWLMWRVCGSETFERPDSGGEE